MDVTKLGDDLYQIDLNTTEMQILAQGMESRPYEDLSPEIRAISRHVRATINLEIYPNYRMAP